MSIFSVWKKVLLFSAIFLLIIPYFYGMSKVSAADKGIVKISPTPQSLKVRGQGFSLTPKVGIVVGEKTDEQAVNEVVSTLKSADVKKIVRKKAGEKIHTPVTIWIGGADENPDSANILQNMKVEGPESLKKEGYVLAASSKDKKQIVLAGKDKTGTYYAAKSFKQIIQREKGKDRIPEVEVRDWPEMPIRGSIEGFYGTPWSHDDRLSQLDFYGEQKLNTYIYAPKDDPYHRDDWRDPYPEKDMKQIKDLINKAQENHVNFTFSLSPGQSICYSGDKDFDALKQKMETMWDLGVRSYAIFLDDISKDFHCEQDNEKFGDDKDPSAAAHAYLLNRFNKEFIQKHEGAERLITVPTDYSGDGTTTYRDRFADLLDKDVVVMWTGPKVVSEEITSEGAEEIHHVFKHDLLLWDNYPVNDFDRESLFLGPLVQRDPDLTEHGVLGLTANPMNEAEASKIPMYTIADYTWNPDAYEPEKSWKHSIQSFGGNAAELLKKFAENSYSSSLDGKESLTLSPLIESFWKAYAAQDNANHEAEKLTAEFKKLQQVPEELKKQMDNEKFLDEVDPYLKKLKLYGEAGETAVNYLTAIKKGNIKQANTYRGNLVKQFSQSEKIPQKMGGDVIKSFLVQSALQLPPLEYTLQSSIDKFQDTKSDKFANTLINKFKGLQQTADDARENIHDKEFLKAIDPYLQNLSVYGEAGVVAVQYVMAQKEESPEKADEYKKRLKKLMIGAYQMPQKIGGAVIRPFLIDSMWSNRNVVDYRKLDGINRSRGAGELIQYTPAKGNTTGTNQWGYEVTVEDGVVTKRGGNDSAIPENGYVLSIHANDWLRDNATIGSHILIEDGIVLVTNPKTKISDAHDLQKLAGQFEADGEIGDKSVSNKLEIHLRTVSHYEKIKEAEKVIKHLKGFQLLVDHYEKQGIISEKAYQELQSGTDSLIDKWQ